MDLFEGTTVKELSVEKRREPRYYFSAHLIVAERLHSAGALMTDSPSSPEGYPNRFCIRLFGHENHVSRQRARL